MFASAPATLAAKVLNATVDSLSRDLLDRINYTTSVANAELCGRPGVGAMPPVIQAPFGHNDSEACIARQRVACMSRIWIRQHCKALCDGVVLLRSEQVVGGHGQQCAGA